MISMYMPKNKELLNSTQRKIIAQQKKRIEFLERKIAEYEQKFVTLKC